GGRVAAIAIAVALVVGVAGGGTAYFLLKDDGKSSQSSDSPNGGSTPTKKNSPTPAPAAEEEGDGEDGGSGATTDPMPSVDPEPATFTGINLTLGYHLTLGDDDVRPQDGEDAGYELTYDSGGYLEAEAEGGKLVLLDPGQQGSLDICRSETRFADDIGLEKLTKGRQVCVITGTGHLALVTYQGHSPDDSPSDYMTIDLTVWRNASR
ncbi:serine/threonine protein kinase, partial [Streptomyces sp. NPDC047939]